jgi:hypothetical protein
VVVQGNVDVLDLSKLLKLSLQNLSTFFNHERHRSRGKGLQEKAEPIEGNRRHRSSQNNRQKNEKKKKEASKSERASEREFVCERESNRWKETEYVVSRVDTRAEAGNGTHVMVLSIPRTCSEHRLSRRRDTL